MANTSKLLEVVAKLAERNDEYRAFASAVVGDQGGEELWSLALLKGALGYADEESIDSALNRAKITAEKNGISIRENFISGDLFSVPDDCLLTKYAAILFVVYADPNKEMVAKAHHYFSLLVNKQQLEDEKRLRTRLDVATENRKLQGIAEDKGVTNYPKFNAVGVKALYGGLLPSEIAPSKGLSDTSNYLDYAGSEELAANLFRITQTAAALRRQEYASEPLACNTHKQVSEGVRQAIKKAGNTLPENLPACESKIDAVATRVKKSL